MSERQEKINEQIELAKKVNACGMQCVVISTARAGRSKREWFGFRFSHGCLTVGQSIVNDDQTVSIVEHIL